MIRISQDSPRATAIANSVCPADVRLRYFPAPLANLEFAAARHGDADEVVVEFGVACRSNADIITEMLAKLDMPKPMVAAAPPRLMHPVAGAPPDILRPAHCLEHPVLPASKSAADEQFSTVDEFPSENAHSFETPASSFEVMPSAPANKTAHQRGMTTLMVRNIPAAYTQDMLLSEWHQTANFDFLYLPKIASGQTNMGYAFINFVSEEEADSFKSIWQKQFLAGCFARKHLTISFADVQGIRANVLQLKKKRVRCMEMPQCEPIIVKNGRLVRFAEAIESFTITSKGMRRSV